MGRYVRHAYDTCDCVVASNDEEERRYTYARLWMSEEAYMNYGDSNEIRWHVFITPPVGRKSVDAVIDARHQRMHAP